MDTTQLVKWINKLISADKMVLFYMNKLWLELKAEVLREQHNECQDCKVNGKIINGTKQFIVEAETVHHEMSVKDFPQYALSKYIVINGINTRQLTALCNDCHNKRHHRFGHSNKEQLNIERW